MVEMPRSFKPLMVTTLPILLLAPLYIFLIYVGSTKGRLLFYTWPIIVPTIILPIMMCYYVKQAGDLIDNAVWKTTYSSDQVLTRSAPKTQNERGGAKEAGAVGVFLGEIVLKTSIGELRIPADKIAAVLEAPVVVGSAAVLQLVDDSEIKLLLRRRGLLRAIRRCQSHYY